MAKAGAGLVGRRPGFSWVRVPAAPTEAVAEDEWGYAGSFLRLVLCVLTDVVIGFR